MTHNDQDVSRDIATELGLVNDVDWVRLSTRYDMETQHVAQLKERINKLMGTGEDTPGDMQRTSPLPL